MTMPDEVVTAFPSLRPPWPAQLVPSGIGSPRWGEWDHETGGVTVADPADDPRLPGLRDWVGVGELVAYRPGWRAVLRVPAPPAGDAGDAGDACGGCRSCGCPAQPTSSIVTSPSPLWSVSCAVRSGSPR